MASKSSTPYDAGKAATAWIGSTMKSFNISPVFDPGISSVIDRLDLYLNSQRKDTMTHVVAQAWVHIVKQNEMISSRD